MKKACLILMAFVLALLLCACENEKETKEPEEEIIDSESDIKTETEPEQEESIEKIPESYIKAENGKLSGMIHQSVPYSQEREKVFENELVAVSMSVPEGWEQGTLEEEGEIYGITFTMPWDERFETYLFVYKDDGTVYDYFYDYYSWNLKINDHTFNEVSGNFSKGVYIRVDSPSKNLGDSENWFLSSQWFYVLQFEGYVVVLHQNVRLNDDYTPFAEHEKACNDFAASIKIEISSPENEIPEPEKATENTEKEETEEVPQSYVTYEDGKTSGILQTCIYVRNQVDAEYSGEFAEFSFAVPEGWNMETLEKEGSIYGFSFAVPWSEDDRAIVLFYKDDGKVYDDLLEMNSLWVGLNEYTYHEISGNFSKGSYIRFDYPSWEKYDHEEGEVPVYGRFHQLQFDGCVVSVNVYIRIDSEENTLEDERICDEFISSIEVFQSKGKP